MIFKESAHPDRCTNLGYGISNGIVSIAAPQVFSALSGNPPHRRVKAGVPHRNAKITDIPEPQMTRAHAWTALILVAKLALTGSLIWLLVAKVDISSALDHMGRAHPAVLMAAIMVVLGVYFLGAVRMVLALKLLGTRFPILSSMNIVMIGAFFSQALVTFLSGDAYRIWHLSRAGVEVLKAASAILLDRALGTIALAGLFFATLPVLLQLAPDPIMRWSLVGLALSCFAGIAVFLLLGAVRPEKFQSRRIVGPLTTIASVSRHTWAAPRLAGHNLVVSVGLHLVNVLAIFVLAKGYGMDMSFFACLIVVPAVTLLSMIPISIAGWGVREGAMVVGFGLFGAPAELAIAVSITYGLAVLVASLPGGILWLIARKSTPPKPTGVSS
jgi:uncharacterized membrane protein YbhN (UPF0104 family)